MSTAIASQSNNGISANEIVKAAQADLGHAYLPGGIPGTNGKSPWDCSSAVNWWLGKKCGLKLPLMKRRYNGATHGPVVINYVTWRGATTVHTPEAGDLCIWPGIGAGGHIGIAISKTHMISALNPVMKTAKTPIKGFGPPGIPVMYRRIKGIPATGQTPTPATDTSFFGDLSNVDSFFADMTSADFWERAGLIVFGAILVIVGILILNKSSPSASIKKTGRSLNQLSGPTAPNSEDTEYETEMLDVQRRRVATRERAITLDEAIDRRRQAERAAKAPNAPSSANRARRVVRKSPQTPKHA